MKLADGETRDADWRAAMNAMGEVPVLETGGQANIAVRRDPAVARRNRTATSHSMPDQRFEAMRWLFFDNHKFTQQLCDAPVSTLLHAAAGA